MSTDTRKIPIVLLLDTAHELVHDPQFPWPAPVQRYISPLVQKICQLHRTQSARAEPWIATVSLKADKDFADLKYFRPAIDVLQDLAASPESFCLGDTYSPSSGFPALCGFYMALDVRPFYTKWAISTLISTRPLTSCATRGPSHLPHSTVLALTTFSMNPFTS